MFRQMYTSPAPAFPTISVLSVSLYPRLLVTSLLSLLCIRVPPALLSALCSAVVFGDP